MKIIAYGVRKDEEPYLNEWAQNHPDVEVKKESEILTEDSVNKADGFDGVVVLQREPLSAPILDKLASFGIKSLSLRNVGVDNLDGDAAKKDGITVTNVPAYSPAAIAELAVTEMMRLLRNTKKFETKESQGNFTWAPDIADEMNQQTVGVYGAGRIGKVVIQILRGLGAKVIAYDPIKDPQLEKDGIYVDSPEDLWKESDIVTLHAPGLPETERAVNDDSIAQMKDGVRIINCARGSLLDTDALIRGLDSGKVKGAALDVCEGELPIFDHNLGSFSNIPAQMKNLMERDNVLITPHIAFYTKPAVKNMMEVALNSNLALLNREEPATLVNFK